MILKIQITNNFYRNKNNHNKKITFIKKIVNTEYHVIGIHYKIEKEKHKNID